MNTIQTNKPKTVVLGSLIKNPGYEIAISKRLPKNLYMEYVKSPHSKDDIKSLNLYVQTQDGAFVFLGEQEVTGLRGGYVRNTADVRLDLLVQIGQTTGLIATTRTKRFFDRIRSDVLS